jgi:hypothetical protein
MAAGCDPNIWGQLLVTGPCTDCAPSTKCKCDAGRDQDYGRYAPPLGSPSNACGGPEDHGFSPVNVIPRLPTRHP